ncbi:hypothetical protein CYMTET_16270 [Cymbomonas tetramitiformis]|uniref:Uncharacterized protein n=1 Tax=Cymbomonas tetramitiformis TaxID=36881 RepID=A0AAE0L837_9CHLO|nr:hypothetical protein CYMTET_16270 [Cymbomonas tetramitiformis]
MGTASQNASAAASAVTAGAACAARPVTTGAACTRSPSDHRRPSTSQRPCNPPARLPPRPCDQRHACTRQRLRPPAPPAQLGPVTTPGAASSARPCDRRRRLHARLGPVTTSAACTALDACDHRRRLRRAQPVRGALHTVEVSPCRGLLLTAGILDGVQVRQLHSLAVVWNLHRPGTERVAFFSSAAAETSPEESAGGDTPRTPRRPVQRAHLGMIVRAAFAPSSSSVLGLTTQGALLHYTMP